ncbi:MAG: cytochrome c-type biogenesis protein CcmH [Chloroflexi bacterium]|nr:cytochrome c-type biogenesis protein CcmH [Chloroflexota bacterium]
MRGLWRLGALLALSATLGLILWAACSGGRQSETLEERAQGIDRSLMCPVCPSETIDQSRVELAKQMRAIVREKLALGQSREEILGFFVERYGPKILAEPPKKGFSLLIWVVPPVVILLGAGLTFFVLREMNRGSKVIPSQGKEDKELQPYLAKVDEEMGQLQKQGEK